MRKILLCLLLICIFFVSSDLYGAAPAVKSDAAVLMDAKTGQIIYSKNMNKKEYPASITKIMTGLIAAENGNMNDTVSVSQNVIDNIPRNTTHIALNVGEKIPLNDAMYALLMESANDAAYAIGEYIAGDNKTFVKLMNQRAHTLGANNTNFVNAHGLYNDNHYTTAHDMALITRAAVNNQVFMKYFGIYQYTIPATNKQPSRIFNNQHKMIPPGKYSYDGVIGGKLGWTTPSQNTMVTIAKRDNRTLICVVLKSKEPIIKYNDTKALLDYGFDQFKEYYISADDLPKDRVDIVDKENKIIGEGKIYAEHGISYLLHQTVDNNKVVMTYEKPNKTRLDTPITVEYSIEDNIATTYPVLTTAILTTELLDADRFSIKKLLITICKIVGGIIGLVIILYLVLLIINIFRKLTSRRRKIRLANKPKKIKRSNRKRSSNRLNRH